MIFISFSTKVCENGSFLPISSYKPYLIANWDSNNIMFFSWSALYISEILSFKCLCFWKPLILFRAVAQKPLVRIRLYSHNVVLRPWNTLHNRLSKSGRYHVISQFWVDGLWNCASVREKYIMGHSNGSQSCPVFGLRKPRRFWDNEICYFYFFG